MRCGAKECRRIYTPRPLSACDRLPDMNLFCFIGFHKRSLSAISLKRAGPMSLCETCGRPLIRRPDGKWVPTDPLA